MQLVEERAPNGFERIEDVLSAKNSKTPPRVTNSWRDWIRTRLTSGPYSGGMTTLRRRWEESRFAQPF